jgi:glyoxylase-like metal-dependent hydrolase (beta-lactamase superfamily II)
MKVIPLYGNRKVYSCRSYLVLGDWNRIEDRNTLIDTGSDGSIIHEIEKLSTGVGKRPVDQIILTHNHFDHVGGITALKERYKARVYAFAERNGVDEQLSDGRWIRIGDRYCQVIQAHGHSHDSICLYSPEQKLLFSGDTPIRIMTREGSYTNDFVRALEKIARLDIEIVYSGHDDPLEQGAGSVIRRSLENVLSSRPGRRSTINGACHAQEV